MTLQEIYDKLDAVESDLADFDRELWDTFNKSSGLDGLLAVYMAGSRIHQRCLDLRGEISTARGGVGKLICTRCANCGYYYESDDSHERLACDCEAGVAWQAAEETTCDE